MADSPFLYQELASYITELVDKGTLTPGTRVPSLREISHDRGVGLSTALQAYQILEDRGVIEARPKSGYYVAQARRVSFGKPDTSAPPGRAVGVAVSRIVRTLREHSTNPGMVPLGSAVPNQAILAKSQLHRHLARTVRRNEYNTYVGPKGDMHLRTEIARRAMRWGQALAPEDIVITLGCTEALCLALRSTTEPGQTVAVESPTYFGLLLALEALHLKALELPTDPTTGVDLHGLERALATNNVAACLFASSFSNPLGCTVPDAQKKAALEILATHGVPLIEDDIYGDLSFGAERPKPYSAFDDNGNTLYCSSFSKTVAPGYRVGWIVAKNRTDTVMQRKFGSTGCGPVILQRALADYLECGGYDHYLRSMRAIFHSNLEHTCGAINRYFPKGTKLTQPLGGFVLWVELPRCVNTRVLFEAALEDGICFAPGDVFSTSDQYNNCLRLSLAQPWDARLEKAVRRLGELASSLLQSESVLASLHQSTMNKTAPEGALDLCACLSSPTS